MFFIYFLYLLFIGRIIGLKNLFLFCKIVLCPNECVLCLAENLMFHEIHLLIVDSSAYVNVAMFRKSLPVAISSRIFQIFSSKRFRVSDFILRPLIHLELSFVYMVISMDVFALSYMLIAIQYYQSCW